MVLWKGDKSGCLWLTGAFVPNFIHSYPEIRFILFLQRISLILRLVNQQDKMVAYFQLKNRVSLIFKISLCLYAHILILKFALRKILMRLNKLHKKSLIIRIRAYFVFPILLQQVSYTHMTKPKSRLF